MSSPPTWLETTRTPLQPEIIEARKPLLSILKGLEQNHALLNLSDRESYVTDEPPLIWLL
jgi:hypothetical protein